MNEAFGVGAGSGSEEGLAREEDRITLSGRLTINEADTLRDALLRALSGCRRLTIETAEIETVDVTGLQLLISARVSAERAGKSLRLATEPKGALLAALVSAGFRSAGDAAPTNREQDGFWWGSN